jgi:hypothetical protein
MDRLLTMEAQAYIYWFWLSYLFALSLFGMVGRLKGS